MTVNMFKAAVESLRGRKHDFALPQESIVSEERDASDSSYNPGRNSNSDYEYCAKNYQNGGELVETQYSLPTGKSKALKEGTYSYIGKTISGTEAQGTRTCFTGDGFHTVKDMSIDEGMHSIENIKVERTKDWDVSSRSNYSPTNGKHNLTKDVTGSTTDVIDGIESISDNLKYSSVNERPFSVILKNDEQCPENSHAGGDKLDISSPSVEAISEKQLLPLQDFENHLWHSDSSSLNNIDEKKHSIDKMQQGSFEERTSTTKSLPSTAEYIQNSGIKGSSTTSEVKSGLITFHFDTKQETANDIKECTNYCQIGIVHVPQNEEVIVDGATTLARSSFILHGHGDLSFCEPGPLSGPVASSGHISYSGSISLGSDSTASTRSFAFPIMQTEWSSPVRMAKPDRRRLRKHRGWRRGLFCCRF